MEESRLLSSSSSSCFPLSLSTPANGPTGPPPRVPHLGPRCRGRGVCDCLDSACAPSQEPAAGNATSNLQTAHVLPARAAPRGYSLVPPSAALQGEAVRGAVSPRALLRAGLGLGGRESACAPPATGPDVEGQGGQLGCPPRPARGRCWTTRPSDKAVQQPGEDALAVSGAATGLAHLRSHRRRPLRLRRAPTCFARKRRYRFGSRRRVRLRRR